MLGRYYVNSGENAVDLTHPRPEDLDLDEIEAKLHTIRRYGGHPKALTIKEHVYLVLLLIDASPRRATWDVRFYMDVTEWAEHHDDHEGVLGDILDPIKRLLAQRTDILYRIERALDMCIIEKRKLRTPSMEVVDTVHQFDRVAGAMEWTYCIGNEREPWMHPIPEWACQQAELMIDRAKTVTRSMRHELGLA